MNRTSLRITSAAFVIGGLLLVGCGSDDDNGGGDSAPAVDVRPEYEELCDVAANPDRSTSLLDRAEAQLEAAPPELEEDFEKVVALLALRSADNPDADELAQITEEGTPAFARVVAAITEECGFNPI